MPAQYKGLYKENLWEGPQIPVESGTLLYVPGFQGTGSM